MRPIVKWWLAAGLILIFFQIFIGGVTRLTGSGLSITKWEIITGTLPPMTSAQWDEAFDLYKETPQYQKINEGMSMSSFKFIYFWEYFHRLWARSMGFIFLFPFLFFVYKGWLPKDKIRQLLILVGLTSIVATFGWIMVASGLNDRPWVSAYKLTWHLSLALIVYSYMAWIVFEAWRPHQRSTLTDQKRGIWIFVILLSFQIMLGGIMSGAKAGLSYPTWPDMNGQWIPAVLLDAGNWKWSNFLDYDQNVFFPAFIQFFHRCMAYIVLVFGVILIRRLYRYHEVVIRKSALVLAFVLFLQVLLGIFTVMACKGQIPVGLGVSHQAVAVFLLTTAIWLLYLSKPLPNGNT